MKSFKKNLHWFDLSTFLKFTGGNLVYQVIATVCDIWILKLVDVSSMGMWQYALLLQSYVVISRLGIINAFNREYPYLLSCKDEQKSSNILNVTTFHVTVTSILQALFFLLFAGYNFFESNVNLAIAMLAMLFYTVFDALANFEEAKLRGSLNFKTISSSKLLLSFFSIVTILMPQKFGFQGLLVRAVFLQILLFGFLKYNSSIKSTPKLNVKVWLSLFNDGWKFWFWSYLKSFNKSLPKLFIVKVSSLTILGLYTPINWLLLSFTLLTSNISSYLYPVLSQQFAKGQGNLLIQTLKINFIVFLIGIPIAAIGIFYLPSLVNIFLPQYKATVFSMQLTLVASLFDIIGISATVWASMKDWKRMYVSTILITLINLLSLGWLYFNKANIISNIGYCVLFSSIASSLLIVLMILQHEVQIKKKATILFA